MTSKAVKLPTCEALVSSIGEPEKRCADPVAGRWAKEVPFNICQQHWGSMSRYFHGSANEQKEQVQRMATDAIDVLTRLLPSPPPVRVSDTRSVYFIRCGEYVKIGVSRDPQARLKTLRTSGNGTLAPRGIDLWEAELVGVLQGGAAVEADMHDRFARLRDTGEWFMHADELAEFVARLRERKAA